MLPALHRFGTHHERCAHADPEHSAMEVLWGFSLALLVVSLIKTGVSGDRHLWLRPGASSGARFGAVVLHEKVLNALDSRVVRQVTPAGSGRPAGAVGVGAQGATVASIASLPANSTTKVQGSSYKLRVTFQYFTLCPYCSHGENEKNSVECMFISDYKVHVDLFPSVLQKYTYCTHRCIFPNKSSVNVNCYQWN